MKTRILISKILKSISILLILYVFVSRGWNAFSNKRAVGRYNQSVSEAQTVSGQEDGKSDFSRMLSEARTYNEELFEAGTNHIAEYTAEALANQDSPDTPSADGSTFGYPDSGDDRYKSLADPAGDGQIGNIDIPSIGVSLPVYHESTDEVLRKGVGHLYGSSLPVGGINSHAVLTGHRGLPSSRLFTDLDKVSTGDTFTLHVLGEDLVYEVDQILTVLPDDLDDLSIEPGQDLVTLLTCTPYGVNDHRLLVRGKRISSAQEESENSTGAEDAQQMSQQLYQSLTTQNVTIALGMAALAAGIVLLAVIWKPHRKS